MKIENVKNNVENKETYKVRSILLGDGHFLFRLKKKSTSPTWSYFDVENNNGITLIALIITIIIMLILAGVVISLTIGENGIFNTAKYAVSETKKAQVQEEIQLAVTDIVTRYLSKENELTNIILKEEIEKYSSLQGITIDENLIGKYKGYNYYIDEQYVVHIGEKVQEKPFTADINIQETKRKVTVTVTNAEEEIQKIELIAPNGKVIATKDIGEEQTSGDIAGVANLSGKYRVKVTSKSEKIANKTINVEQIKITNKDEMVEFGEMVNSGVTFEGDTVELLSDIDLGGSSSNRNWKAIGDSTTTQYFAGTFEGNSHKIFNLYNQGVTEPRQGLFGCINGGTVQNLGIESGYIMCKFTAGGIVGKIDNGNIINCYNKAKIECLDSTGTAGSMLIGGLVGGAGNSTIKDCYNEGKINGSLDVVGGIVATISSKTEVINCYNIGNVTTLQTLVGGIVGNMAKDGESIIRNCYNKGNIDGWRYVGGLVGRVSTGNEINNGYSTGKVTSYKGVTDSVGGVIGEHSGVLSNLFFINTAGPAYGCGINNTDHGPGAGSTEAKLKGLTNTLNGEQNPAPWEEDNTNINGGYPILSFQKSPKADEEE